MTGYRKLVLGLAFLAGCFGLSLAAIFEGVALASLSTVIVAISAGLAGIIWGNVQEHKSKNGGVQ